MKFYEGVIDSAYRCHRNLGLAETISSGLDREVDVDDAIMCGFTMAETKKCFVISPIGSEGSPERKHADMTLNAIIRPAIEMAAPQTFEVKRADEFADVGMITDHVIVAILDADLIIADLSFLNPNVFYEIGLAHMADKPTIHVSHKDTKLPFDNVG